MNNSGWLEAVGSTADPKLTDLKPDRVFIEYDGPRVFITRDRESRLLLAYHCVEEDDHDIYYLTTFTHELVERLTQGGITLYEALDQPAAWILKVNRERQVDFARRVRRDDVPFELLPDPSAILWQSSACISATLE